MRVTVPDLQGLSASEREACAAAALLRRTRVLPWVWLVARRSCSPLGGEGLIVQARMGLGIPQQIELVDRAGGRAVVEVEVGRLRLPTRSILRDLLSPDERLLMDLTRSGVGVAPSALRALLSGDRRR